MKRLSVERRRRVNGIYVKCGFSHNNDERHVKSWKINDEFYNASRLSYAWWGVNIFVRWCLHWNRQTSGKEYEIEPKEASEVGKFDKVLSQADNKCSFLAFPLCARYSNVVVFFGAPHTHTHSSFFRSRTHRAFNLMKSRKFFTRRDSARRVARIFFCRRNGKML